MKTTDSSAASNAKSPLLTLCRVFTFTAALGFMALIVIYPRAIADDMSSVPHGALVGLLFGMSIAWVCSEASSAAAAFFALVGLGAHARLFLDHLY